jgi:deoxyribonuclease-4
MSCCSEHKFNKCDKLNGDISCVGITAGWAGTAKESLKCCQLLKCRCAQLYGNAIFDSAQKIPQKAELSQYLNDQKITMIVHAPIWINLANGESEKKSKSMLQSQLNDIRDLPALLNFHIGNNGSIERVAQNINMMNIKTGTHERYPIQLVAEVSASCGTQLGGNFEDLRRLYEGVDNGKLGLCMDSAHIFGSGMSNFDGHESVVKLFDNLEECAKKVCLIHLNDSKADFGSKVDRHAGIEKGKIWSKDNESLKSLLSRISEHEIDTVLETGSSQIEDLKKIQGYFQNEI